MSNNIADTSSVYFSRQLTEINNIKNQVNTEKSSVNNSFDNMLNEKISKDGTVNKNKLNKTDKKLLDTCIELESFFWKQVLNSMKKTINKHKMLDGGPGEDFFSDMLYDEYSKIMAKTAKTGISDEMFKQLAHLR